MKFIKYLLFVVFLAPIGATSSYATGPQGTIQHVIIVIQENRTPTNLFFADSKLSQNGAHVTGPNNSKAGPCKVGNTQVALLGVPLTGFCFDPNHFHFGLYPGWNQQYNAPQTWPNQYDNGAMDGACTNYVDCSHCSGGCPSDPQYTYASNSDGSLTPLFSVAEQYGFANWMFQTNQGPSFPAHQFLFSGTSAPEDNPSDSPPYYHEWFVAENPYPDSSGMSTGCTAPAGVFNLQIEPPPFLQQPEERPGFDGDTSGDVLPNAGFPCYHHPSLPTLLDNNQPRITWRYYSPNTNLWNAPLAIWDICQPGEPNQGGGTCNSTSDYQQYVAPYTGTYGPGKALTDLGVAGTGLPDCKLQQVSWVIPDGNWSDHPGGDASNAGPSWVASIVNAVGGYDNSGNPLSVQCNYWTNTVVIVTWDDWGGFYDDIAPPEIGYPGQNAGGQQYVYGFRVPLLVVSAYTPSGYISGPCNAQTGSCSGAEVAPYIHDFGSVLNFVEYVFGTGGNPLGWPNPGISPSYPYADYWAPDGHNVYPASPYSLSDFFNFPMFGNSPRTFTPIPAPIAQGCFISAGNDCPFTTYGLDPDDDAVEQ